MTLFINLLFIFKFFSGFPYFYATDGKKHHHGKTYHKAEKMDRVLELYKHIEHIAAVKQIGYIHDNERPQ